MKSKPQGDHLQTSCKECVFSVYENDTQTGCSANRLDILKDDVVEAYDDDKKFYVIDSFCNFFRPPKWNGGEPDIDRAVDENQPRFSIAIYIDGLTKSLSQKTLNSISKITYNKDRVRFIISQMMNSPTEEKQIGTSMYNSIKSMGFKASQVVTVFTDDMRDHDTFKESAMGYISKICPGDTIPESFFERVDASLNEDRKRAVVFSMENISAVSFMVFRMSYNNYKNYDRFEEELKKEASKSSMMINFT